MLRSHPVAIRMVRMVRMDIISLASLGFRSGLTPGRLVRDPVLSKPPAGEPIPQMRILGLPLPLPTRPLHGLREQRVGAIAHPAVHGADQLPRAPLGARAALRGATRRRRAFEVGFVSLEVSLEAGQLRAVQVQAQLDGLGAVRVVLDPGPRQAVLRRAVVEAGQVNAPVVDVHDAGRRRLQGTLYFRQGQVEAKILRGR